MNLRPFCYASEASCIKQEMQMDLKDKNVLPKWRRNWCSPWDRSSEPLVGGRIKERPSTSFWFWGQGTEVPGSLGKDFGDGQSTTFMMSGFIRFEPRDRIWASSDHSSGCSSQGQPVRLWGPLAGPPGVRQSGFPGEQLAIRCPFCFYGCTTWV